MEGDGDGAGAGGWGVARRARERAGGVAAPGTAEARRDQERVYMLDSCVLEGPVERPRISLGQFGKIIRVMRGLVHLK